MAERLITEQLQQLVIDKANQHGINPQIALAQIARESANYRPDVVYGPFVGGAGERGMSQFTPATWARFGSGPHNNAYIPEMAMEAWGRYMAYLMSLFPSDYLKALASYNGGEGHLTNPGKYGPPSQAAQAYAQAIYSQAGFTENSVVNLDQIEVTAGGLPIWLILGAAGLLLWVALSD
jgi:soluble lytic murein transglycosylase-like protein